MKLPITLLTLSLGLGLTLSFDAYPAAIAAPSTLVAASQTAQLTPEQLQNATYQIPDYGSITLSNGYYQSTSGLLLAVKMSKTIVYGDLNGDGVPDAATVLKLNKGGQDVSFYLAAVLNKGGNPDNRITVLLGDRLKVKSLSIKNEKVLVKLLKYAPTDPECCPSLESIQAYHYDHSTSQLQPTSLAIDERYPGTPTREVIVPSPEDRKLGIPQERELEIDF